MAKRGEFDDPTEPDARGIELAGAGADQSLDGERFGRYELIGDLAFGGMAELLLAVQEGPEGFIKVVVVKRLIPHYARAPELVQMFIDEARLTARLEHPNIVRTYEFGAHEDQYYTVMEYLPGEDLGQVLHKLDATAQQLPLHIAVAIVTRVLAGLDFAHELTDRAGNPLDVVHRDLTPSNIVITYTGEVKILDFGIAKTSISHSGGRTLMGKLAYMAPEQILGAGTDRRADVFSTGVVLWEALTGRQLFARDNEAASLYAIVHDPVPSPRVFRPDVPPLLETIVMRALSRTPADRYEAAGDMRLALELFMSRQPRVDEHVIAHFLDELFGTVRAEAKRSIAQARSLTTNIGLVMKPRAHGRQSLPAPPDGTPPAHKEPPPAAERYGAAIVPMIAAKPVPIPGKAVGTSTPRATAGASQPSPSSSPTEAGEPPTTPFAAEAPTETTLPDIESEPAGFQRDDSE